MMQTTIRNLCDQLAAALGLTMRAVDYIAGDLQRADMIGAMDESARVEDAARLIVAAAGDFDVRAPRSVCKRFWDLPLVETEVCVGVPDRRTFLTRPRDAGSFAATRKAFGDDFGTAFNNLIGDMVCYPHREPSPGSLTLVGGPGHTSAILSLGSPDGVMYLNFGHPELLDGALPHGLAVACPQRSVRVPATIYSVLAVALEGSPCADQFGAERVDVYTSRLRKGE